MKLTSIIIIFLVSNISCQDINLREILDNINLTTSELNKFVQPFEKETNQLNQNVAKNETLTNKHSPDELSDTLKHFSIDIDPDVNQVIRVNNKELKSIPNKLDHYEKKNHESNDYKYKKDRSERHKKKHKPKYHKRTHEKNYKKKHVKRPNDEKNHYSNNKHNKHESIDLKKPHYKNIHYSNENKMDESIYHKKPQNEHHKHESMDHKRPHNENHQHLYKDNDDFKNHHLYSDDNLKFNYYNQKLKGKSLKHGIYPNEVNMRTYLITKMLQFFTSI